MKNILVAMAIVLVISSSALADSYPWATNDVLSAAALNNAVRSALLPNPNPNILGLSTDFSTGWTVTAATKTSSQPDWYGANRSVKLTETAANGTIANTTALTVPAGKYIASAYFKFDGAHYAAASLHVLTGIDNGIWFDADCSTRNPSGTEEVAHGCTTLPGGEWIWAWFALDTPSTITSFALALGGGGGAGIMGFAFPQLKAGTVP